jgi:hypothetical protein
MSLLLDARHLLDAMDGVAYIVNQNGTIIAIGEPNWTTFATNNDAPDLTSAAVVGTCLFDVISGDGLRQAYRQMHAAISEGRRAAAGFQYRCDAPALERYMHMSIRLIRECSGDTLLLYQSQVLKEAPRPDVDLFGRQWRTKRPDSLTADLVVVLCSFCHRVAWPIGADEAHRFWISPQAYYREGGPGDIAVSDGICPACYASVFISNS